MVVRWCFGVFVVVFFWWCSWCICCVGGGGDIFVVVSLNIAQKSTEVIGYRKRLS